MDTGCSPWRLAPQQSGSPRRQRVATVRRDLARDELEAGAAEDAFADPLRYDVDQLLVLVRSEHTKSAVPRRLFGIAGMSPKNARRGTSMAFATPIKASVGVLASLARRRFRRGFAATLQ